MSMFYDIIYDWSVIDLWLETIIIWVSRKNVPKKSKKNDRTWKYMEKSWSDPYRPVNMGKPEKQRKPDPISLNKLDTKAAGSWNIWPM
jgi:hypothetical protein